MPYTVLILQLCLGHTCAFLFSVYACLLFVCVSVTSLQPFLIALSAFLSTVASHLQQQRLPSSDRVMTSPLQATIPGASAAVPSQTQTSYDPQLAQTLTDSDQLLAQSCTSSCPLVAPTETSSGLLPFQAQGGLGTEPAQNQVSCITPISLQIHSSSGLLVA